MTSANSSMSPAETARLAALRALDLLDAPLSPEYGALVRLATIATGCPSAFISLVDAENLWVKASAGPMPATAVPRSESLCDTIILSDAPLYVPDLAGDARFRGHWIVAQGTRFYAGIPIRTTGADGARWPVGTLCVLDDAPRVLSGEQKQAFEDLARIVETLIAAHRTVREAMVQANALQRQQRIFHQTERMAKVGSWRLTLDHDRVEWSEGIFRIHELDPHGPPALGNALDFYPPSERAMVSLALASAIESGRPFDLETDFVTARGNVRRVRSLGEVEWADGRPSAVVGVFRDVTDEHALALALRRSAETDPLTLMPNRTAFTRTLDRAIAAARAAATPLALALVDLDGFKRINDTFGHPVGDEVLKRVAKRLHAPWLQGSCAARLGGDEFAVIIDNMALLADEAALVDRLESELRVQTCVDGLTLESGASIGVTRFDAARFAGQRELIQAADARLYAAKRRRVGDRRCAAIQFPTAA